MVQKFIKFIKKSAYKDVLQKILQDIYDDRLDTYDIEPLAGKKWYFRLRKWTIRFIFKKTPTGNRVIEVNNRWDIY